jgi:integrase
MTQNVDRIQVGDRVVIFPRGRSRIYTAEFHHDGRHCRRSLRTRNRKVAIQRASLLDAELVSGSYETPPPPTTIGSAMEEYLAHLETENRRRRTIQTYRNALVAFRDYSTSKHVGRLHQVTPGTFDGFRAELKVGRSARTVFNQSFVVKMFMSWCRTRRLLAENPLADYPLKMPMPVRKPVPSIVDVWKILDACEAPLLWHLSMIAFTGMRSGECRQLHVEDVDLKSGWVDIVSRVETPTKSGVSRRVPMHEKLREILLPVPNTPGRWFFTSGRSTRHPHGGNWLNTKRLNEAFQRVARKVGLPVGSTGGFTIHSLRRFFKSHCINAGVPKPVVDRWLGHGSRRDLDAVYYELSDEDSRKWMDRVPFDRPENREDKP